MGYFDAFALGDLNSFRFDLGIEANDDGIGSCRQVYIRLVYATDTRRNSGNFYFVGGKVIQPSRTA